MIGLNSNQDHMAQVALLERLIMDICRVNVVKQIHDLLNKR